MLNSEIFGTRLSALDVSLPAMNDNRVFFRRRRYLMLRVADHPVLDMRRFLSGTIAVEQIARCSLLCPVTGEPLPVTAAELELLMTIPADRWVPAAELQAADEELRARLLDLARRGILLSDPPADSWDHLAGAEQVLAEMEWLDIAAVYHAHSRWEGVVGVDASQKTDEETHRMQLEDLRRMRGDPPPHFVERTDASRRIALRTPTLSGSFFETLRARRTTRAYRSDRALPLSALEHMLYAVFGTQGIKEFAPGITAIKRTSPSGGALHPIEGYRAREQRGRDPAVYTITRRERMRWRNSNAWMPQRAFARVPSYSGSTYFAEAHALVIHVARFDRNFWKYAPQSQGYKAVLRIGHLSRRFNLTATHLGPALSTPRLSMMPYRASAPSRTCARGGDRINGVGIADTARNELHFVRSPYQPKGVACCRFRDLAAHYNRNLTRTESNMKGSRPNNSCERSPLIRTTEHGRTDPIAALADWGITSTRANPNRAVRLPPNGQIGSPRRTMGQTSSPALSRASSSSCYS